MVANNVEEGRRVATFLTMMGADAYSLLSNLLIPDKPKDKDYSQLVDAMTSHLKSKPLVIAERFKFHRRGQGEQESVSDYMTELRRLADKCRFGLHFEEALRDRLVCGLRNVAVQKKLLAKESLTLKKAYETALGMEMAAKQARHLQHEVPSADSVQVVSRRRAGSGPPRGWKQPQTQTSPADPPPCFCCGKLGHRPDKCFFKKQKCRQCGSYGHIQRMCPNRRVALVEEDNVEDSPDEEKDVLLNIKTVQTTKKGQILVGLHVDDCPLLWLARKHGRIFSVTVLWTLVQSISRHIQGNHFQCYDRALSVCVIGSKKDSFH